MFPFLRFPVTHGIGSFLPRYLAHLLHAQRPLPRHQEAELDSFVSNGEDRSALVTHDEVREWKAGSRDAIICSVSHAWETREHPDPCRFQLQRVVSHAMLYEAAFQAEVWIFYDYVSLFQYYRDPDSHEQRSFGKAMGNMRVMYSHECTLTFRIENLTPEDVWDAMKQNQELISVWDDATKSVRGKPLKDLVENRTKYVDRGWCKAEIEWSSQRTLTSQHQRIDHTDNDEPGSHGLHGRVPMTPAKFREIVEQAKFSHRSDAGSVIHLQGEACETWCHLAALHLSCFLFCFFSLGFNVFKQCTVPGPLSLTVSILCVSFGSVVLLNFSPAFFWFLLPPNLKRCVSCKWCPAFFFFASFRFCPPLVWHHL